MRTQAFPMPDARDDTQPFLGAMDQVNPTLSLKPGVARRSINFECSLNGGGFTRIQGYERFDGRTAPSSQTYVLVPVPAFTVTPGVGQTVSGMSSGTTATIIVVAADHLAVAAMSPPGFLENEILVSQGGQVIGAVGPQTILLTRSQRLQYRNLAADVFRALIGAVPGFGPVRGVFAATFGGVFQVFAFRDYHVGGAIGDQCVLNRASAAGWVNLLLNMGSELQFIKGSGTAPVEGSQYLYFGTLMTLKRVLLQSGDWTTNDAAGFLVFVESLSGNFHPVLGPTYTIGGATFTPVRPTGFVNFRPGGAFEFDLYNFGGRQSSTRIYGCDGVNRCFEFDGLTVVPITTGIEPISYDQAGYYQSFQDAPTHIRGHQHHLFVTIGSSLINSAITSPYNWQAINGSLETACGDLVSGLQVMPGSQQNGALAVFLRNHTKILYGTSKASTTAPFTLVSFESDTGAVPGTIQKLDKLYYLDDRGVISLNQTLAYGNFTSATLTRTIQPFIDWKRGRAVCSLLSRAKSQYRIFFSDGMGLFLTFDQGKLKGALPVAMPVPFSCAWSCEDNTGQEVSFVGGTDGVVYQLERGTSFDGHPIDFELIPNWNTMKSHRRLKEFQKAAIELMEGDYAEFAFGARLGPELSNHLQDGLTFSVQQEELTMQWDHFEWDDFTWDAHTLSPMELDVKGMSERVQYAISGSSDYLDPFTFTGITSHYFLRRGLR